MRINNIELTDLQGLAEVHILAFERRALAELAAEAVRRYYQWLLNDVHEADRFGLWVDDKLIGFCFSGKFKGALNGFLRVNRNFLILKEISRPWLIFSDFFRQRIWLALRSLNWIKNNNLTSPPQPPKRTYGILSIAVDPGYQGLGYGKILLEHAEKLAIEKGFEWMNLSVDENNHQAIIFYIKNGWNKLIDGKIWTGRMEKYIGPV